MWTRLRAPRQGPYPPNPQNPHKEGSVIRPAPQMDALKCRAFQKRIQGANQRGQSWETAGDELAEVSNNSAEAKNVTNQVSWGNERGLCVFFGTGDEHGVRVHW